ncbi:uncharacterized protein F4812DRAFT_456056 [Daldinia caldariorum]|uniref:uncharacterized protein n=1 Tax=Daldinia caldariorum TaxID=326644 RepID=UPI002008ABCD|nr:uncharacterized protein F4812DRAFT_456056 [Daldinia caldariorum]KAI1471953.1 hypothetical protein F4812DRAFT_456056 [Daldinia caldariorum]
MCSTRYCGGESPRKNHIWSRSTNESATNTMETDTQTLNFPSLKGFRSGLVNLLLQALLLLLLLLLRLFVVRRMHVHFPGSSGTSHGTSDVGRDHMILAFAYKQAFGHFPRS